jgi:hypothetical protein
MSFHLSLVTKEYHWVRSKRFLSLWYVWRKPCIYLAMTLTPSTNIPKQDLTWPTSPRSSIGCIQNDSWAYGMFGANHEPILRQDWNCLQTDQNKLPLGPRHLGIPLGVSKTIPRPMVCSAQTVHLTCTDTSTVSKWTKMRFDTTHVI